MDKFIEKNYKLIIVIVCILGILVKGIYIFKNRIGENQYDSKIWSLYKLEDYEEAYEFNEKNIGIGGHMFYIMLLYKDFHLPDSVVGQYYHPPLHHFIAAVWLRVMDVFPLNAMQKIESLQIISFIYSLLILLFSYKILQKLNIGKKGKILSMILLNFFPQFIYMSGFINNDTLLTLFIVINLYCLIKWYENSNWKNAILVALTIGLGMNVKTSMIVMILPAAIVYLKKFIEKVKSKEKYGKLIWEAVVLVILVTILGFWHQLMLIKKYDWQLFKVQMPYEHFSVKDATFWQRWGIISKELIDNTILVESKNIFSYVINSSLYCLGSFVNASSYIIKEILIVLIFITIFVIAKHSLKKNYEKIKSILIITYISWVIAFIYFNITMPYSCTMHSRYIGILFIIGMIMLGVDIDKSKNQYWRLFIYLVSILFSVLSTYIVLI